MTMNLKEDLSEKGGYVISLSIPANWSAKPRRFSDELLTNTVKNHHRFCDRMAKHIHHLLTPLRFIGWAYSLDPEPVVSPICQPIHHHDRDLPLDIMGITSDAAKLASYIHSYKTKDLDMPRMGPISAPQNGPEARQAELIKRWSIRSVYLSAKCRENNTLDDFADTLVAAAPNREYSDIELYIFEYIPGLGCDMHIGELAPSRWQLSSVEHSAPEGYWAITKCHDDSSIDLFVIPHGEMLARLEKVCWPDISIAKLF